MDNRCWSGAGAYWMDLGDDDWEWEEEEEGRPTSGYTLDVLAQGQSFKFVFDFGENWCFQCKSLREMGGLRRRQAVAYQGRSRPSSTRRQGAGTTGKMEPDPV